VVATLTVIRGDSFELDQSLLSLYHWEEMHIELHSVSKSFARTRALVEFDLNVAPSSIIVLLGENGAGKSTLLRILGGVSVPDSGQVCFDGKVFSREDMELRKRLHFTPDIPLLFTEQTVARNISTLAALYGKSSIGRDEYFAEWLEETGVAALMKRTVGHLSRGQIWKVELACMAVIEPELWLVDEPFASGMDEIGMRAFRRLASHLVAEGGTVIYTTQMVKMAAAFSDHVCVIRDGKNVMWAESDKIRTSLTANPDGAARILRGEFPDS